MNAKRLLWIMLLVGATLACTLPAILRPSSETPSPVPWTPSPSGAAMTATPVPTHMPTKVVVTPTLTPTPAPSRTATPTQTPTWTPPLTPYPTPTFGPRPTPSISMRGPGFAAYAAIPVSLPAAYDGYALPVDLATVGDLEPFALSESQKALLERNGFVVAPAGWLEFYPLYMQFSFERQPVFITTDSVYHAYHLIFDKMLRDLEREHFEPDIRALTAACLRAAQALYADLRGTSSEDTARGVVAYFGVASALIDPAAVTPPEAADLVAEELALIQAHGGMGPSPIFSRNCPTSCDPCDPDPPPNCLDEPCMCEDYSQYVPRGHYTQSEQLERYFRTMMWYGRINMRLSRPEETSMALLIAHILRHTDVNGVPAAAVWARVYDPTTFIVGKSDDLGLYEYSALWDDVFGAGTPITMVADRAKLTAFTEAARKLPPPQINSMWVYASENEKQATQGFRFMGQRFVLDAYVFEQLIWREVGTMEKPRRLPKGLDVMAALGSEEAYALLGELGETAYARYPEQMAKVRGEIAALQPDSWTQNLYWTWLYSFQPLLAPKGAQYPAFMRTQAWTHKDLHTALGSWTELKHDTILYAKQVMGGVGGGGPEELPWGWVEPNPEVYAQLLALTRMTEQGLKNRGLLTETTAANLGRLDDLLAFLLDATQKELSGVSLTREEVERIYLYGGTLWGIALAAADKEGEGGMPWFDDEKQAALVADVATDPDSGRVLEEAVGRVSEITVVVPDGQGNLHLARGGVFAYYEFPWPMDDRLTDEAWQAMLAAGQAPARPAWTDSFVAE
jgi:hypothetical protein